MFVSEHKRPQSFVSPFSYKVEITDRGPYAKGRDIDLSKQAAKQIGIGKEGVAPVKIETKVPSKAGATRPPSQCRK